MKGLELSRRFYEEFGRPLIENDFPEYANRIAVGIAGDGSECFGFDDEVSRDHDFQAGFCLWLTAQDEEKIGFKLMRAYSRLPKEYLGVKIEAQSILATGKYGVHTIESFFEKTIGSAAAPTSWRQWFHLPEYALAQATNGEIFRDDLGELSSIREQLKTQMPQDARLKKLAGHLALAAQSGQYNYSRALSHGESAAAQLALFEFVRHMISISFWLAGQYAPYYKWSFRALSALPGGQPRAKALEMLISTGNEPEQAKLKAQTIEELAADIIRQLKAENLSQSGSDYLEHHAFEVTSRIKTREIASLHVMDFGE